VPSENVPVAVNCLARPLAILGLAGVTVIKLKLAAVMVSSVFPDLLPDVAVITDVPTPIPVDRPLVGRPLGFTVATEIVPDDQITDAVISCDVPSENVPVAMNCLVRPLAMLGLAGVTVIKLKVAAVMVNIAFPDLLPDVAVITDVPAATPVARPLVGRPLGFTVATEIVPDDQVTDAVISCDVPSENVPVAVNCLVRPLAMLGLAGVTVIKLKVAAVTVNVVFPDLLPDVAVITDVPAATPVARPLVGRPLGLMVAIPVVPDDQITDAVISCDVPSENVPVAVNCLVRPLAMLGLAGVTVIKLKVAAVTVSIVSPDTLPDIAVITDAPAAAPVAASPLEFMVAIDFVPDDQVTDVVISRAVPSEYIPVAENCLVRSLGILGFAGVTAMDVSVASELFMLPPQLPHPAIRPTRSNTIKHSIKILFIMCYLLYDFYYTLKMPITLAIFINDNAREKK
jgi:hypothetical protein